MRLSQMAFWYLSGQSRGGDGEGHEVAMLGSVLHAVVSRSPFGTCTIRQGGGVTEVIERSPVPGSILHAIVPDGRLVPVSEVLISIYVQCLYVLLSDHDDQPQ